MVVTVRYLTGISQAHLADGEIEWPPHPERLFQAALSVAIHRDDRESALCAIKALEGLRPIVFATKSSCSIPFNVYGRYISTVDNLALKTDSSYPAGLTMLHGDGPHVAFEYADYPAEQEPLLADILRDVVYLGESSSMVDVRIGSLNDDTPMHVFKPSSSWRDDVELRVPLLGRTDTLIDSFRRRTILAASYLKRKPKQVDEKRSLMAFSDFRERNDLVAFQRYSVSGDAIHSPVELHVAHLERVGTGFHAESFDSAISKYRTTYLDSSHTQDAWVSGHEADGSPTKAPHIGFIPVLDVNRPGATGALLGIGITIPSELPHKLREEAMMVARYTRTIRTHSGRINLLSTDEYRESHGGRLPYCAAPRFLVGPARTWSTVTPALPWRFPTGAEQRRRSLRAPCSESLLEMFDRAGLPRPCRIEFGPTPWVFRATSAIRPDSANLPPKPHPRLWHLHFTFERDVYGPIVLGRAAWKGYGLCIPV